MTRTPLHAEKEVWWEVQEWITGKDADPCSAWEYPGWLHLGTPSLDEPSARRRFEGCQRMSPHAKIRLVCITKTVDSISLYTPDGTQEAEWHEKPRPPR